MSRRRLATYLNDRHAIVTGGIEMSARAAKSNAGNTYGPLLERIGADLEEDRALLRTIMAAHDVSPDRLKSSLAWVGEKLGRLKPNDSLTSYSPLSRVVELDVLTAMLGVLDGTWVALRAHLTTHHDALDQAHERARRNLDELDTVRPAAVGEAIAG